MTCGDRLLRLQDRLAESRAIHFVEVKFRAGEQPGKLQTPIRILTDRGENRGATCIASATVLPAPPVTTAPEPTPDATSAAADAGAVRTASAP